MKIAIVGVGVGGLASIRKALEYNAECVAYEITENIGGTWVYREKIQDEYRGEVPANMYPSLRTNLPTQLMEFRDYKFKPESRRCFPSRVEVLQYLKNYAEEFDLLRHIKFFHKVLNVSRKDESWILSVKNLKTGSVMQEKFDGVMICSGHFSRPRYPDIPGMDTFPQDRSIHSCDYRTNDSYKGKVVLVVGCGASGLDLSRETALVADKVFLSYVGKPLIIAPKNIIQKPWLKKILNNVIFFNDGTSESVDAIIWCTGFFYSYPFLDATCGISNPAELMLTSLYKNFINSKHPSMCVIGLMQKTIIFQLLDLQAEVFVKSIGGLVQLPPIEEMQSEVEKEHEEKMKANISLTHYYHLGVDKERSYFYELYNLGNCQPFAPVIFQIHDKNRELFVNDYDNLRSYNFEIIDDETFTVYLQTNQ